MVLNGGRRGEMVATRKKIGEIGGNPLSVGRVAAFNSIFKGN
jgi:hypothetical protein